MHHPQGHYIGIFNPKAYLRFNQVWDYRWGTWISLIEYIVVFEGKCIHYSLLSIDGNIFLLEKIDWSDIIESYYVVIVLMCIEYSINIIYEIFQKLIAEVRTCVNEDFFSKMFDEDRSSVALVLCKRRCTNLAVATDEGNALRCAGAEYSYFHTASLV